MHTTRENAVKKLLTLSLSSALLLGTLAGCGDAPKKAEPKKDTPKKVEPAPKVEEKKDAPKSEEKKAGESETKKAP